MVVVELVCEMLATMGSRLGERIDMAELARIALTSEHRFRRLFSALEW